MNNKLEQNLIKFVLWIKENKDQFIIITAIFLFLLLTIPLFLQYKGNQYKETLNEFATIENNFYTGKYQDVIQKSDKLLQKNLKKNIKKLTLFFRAQAFYLEGKFDESIKIYDELIVQYPQDYLLANFYDGKAYALEMQEKYQEAIETWYALINKITDSYLIPNSYKAIARNLEILGKYKEAEQTYKMINTMFSETEWAEYSNQRLQTLRTQGKI